VFFFTVLIVYHSQSGAAAALAAAAARGAREEGAQVWAQRCVDTGAGDVAAAKGLLLVCAENSGRLAGGAKDFLDRVFYPLIDRRLTLPYALLVSAGNDGRGAVEEARRIFRGIPFTEALEPRIIRGLPGEPERAEAAEYGAAYAAGLAMGIF
jgi:multimeric flavodoxin WrbA